MGNLEHLINGTKAEQEIARQLCKPWYRKVESWLTVVNILALVVSISVIYWSSYKPSQIRERCLAEAEMNPTAIGTADEVDRYKFIDVYYQSCLHRFGLEK